MKRFFIGAMMVALVGSMIANALLYLRYAGSRPLMTMGQTVITRQDYRDALERQSGKAVLRKLVLARLVEREARLASVFPTETDIDTRLKEMERTTPTVVQDARADATRMYNLRSDVATDLALERLRMRGVTVSDKEVAAYYARNKAQFVRPMQVETTAVMASDPTDAATAAKLLAQDMKPYVIAQQPRLHVVGVGGFQPDFSKLPPADVVQMQTVMGRTRPGEIATIPLGNAYLVFRVKSQQKMQSVPLSAALEDATRMAKLAKAPTPTDYLLRLYLNSKPVFEANQYTEFFREFEEAPVASEKPLAGKNRATQTASR